MTGERAWIDVIRALLFLPDGRSTFAEEVDLLHAVIFLATLAGVFAVFAFTVYCLVRYRTHDPHVLTLQRGTSSWLDVGVIGGLLALFIGVWLAGFVIYARMTTPPDGAIEVYVTAKQWMWKFAYPNGHSSTGVLVVPVGRPVKLVMTSRDVIHSFFVPEFRMKRDVVPGRYSVAWFEATHPGTYQVLCAEFCGFDHSHMRAEVVVLSPAEWAAWDEREGDVAGAVAAAPVPGYETDMAARGRTVAARKGCLSCHTVDGTPHLGPTWVGLYGSEVQLQRGDTVIADEAYLTESMMDPEAKIVAGYPAIMPTFKGQLTSGEAAALVEYIRALAEGTDHEVGQEPPPPAHTPPRSRVDDEENPRGLPPLGEGPLEEGPSGGTR